MVFWITARQTDPRALAFQIPVRHLDPTGLASRIPAESSRYRRPDIADSGGEFKIPPVLASRVTA